MHKFLAFVILVGALIVGAALVYHGKQLASVATQLDALEQRTGALDIRLDAFSEELPALIGQAGHDAGRQAFRGFIDEAIGKPLDQLLPSRAPGSTNANQQVRHPLNLRDLLPGNGTPWIRFDIPDPVVNIDVSTDFRDLPSLSRGAATNAPPVPGEPLQDGALPPVPAIPDGV